MSRFEYERLTLDEIQSALVEAARVLGPDAGVSGSIGRLQGALIDAALRVGEDRRNRQMTETAVRLESVARAVTAAEEDNLIGSDEQP